MGGFFPSSLVKPLSGLELTLRWTVGNVLSRRLKRAGQLKRWIAGYPDERKESRETRI